MGQFFSDFPCSLLVEEVNQAGGICLLPPFFLVALSCRVLPLLVYRLLVFFPGLDSSSSSVTGTEMGRRELAGGNVLVCVRGDREAGKLCGRMDGWAGFDLARRRPPLGQTGRTAVPVFCRVRSVVSAVPACVVAFVSRH